MGLEMFLYKRNYVKSWESMEPEERHTVTVKRNGVAVPKNEIDPTRLVWLIQKVGYWRKANAVHKWFVDNVQDGKDDRDTYYVRREQMRELLATVNKVLEASELVDGTVSNGYTFKDGKRIPITEAGKVIKDASVAHQLLPTHSGLFFGSTDYDQRYYEDLVRTKEILEAALQEPACDFEYHSRW